MWFGRHMWPLQARSALQNQQHSWFIDERGLCALSLGDFIDRNPHFGLLRYQVWVLLELCNAEVQQPVPSLDIVVGFIPTATTFTLLLVLP